ncbi:MAG: hypothetical protein AAFX93_19735 [Verrucomicrobiota bacterium]
MPKVTIVLTDSEDGAVNLDANFEPELKPEDSTSPAQYAAFKMMQCMAEMANEGE